MPRQARLDAHGVLHHVMIRGIKRRKIFINDGDREDFQERRYRWGKAIAREHGYRLTDE